MLEPNFDLLLEKNQFQLLDLLDSGDLISNPKVINFYIPSFVPQKVKSYGTTKNLFQTYSITGNKCRLNCNHCEAKILRTMKPTTTPKKLFDAANKLKKEGGIGCLISGGSQLDGSISLKKFIPTIEKIKHDLGLTVFVHTGIINFETAKELKKAKVDLALIDVIGSKKTLKKLDIKINLKDYINSLKALHEAKLCFVPHVIVGLDDNKLESEFNALKIISSTRPCAIVIIGFMPIYGTIMGQNQPANPEDIAKVLVASRLMFPKTPIALGCMRQKGKNRSITELYALKAGVAAIAYPTRETKNYAKDNDYKIIYQSYCCAQIYSDYIS
jgi:uncharacterized radical SAM superfamily protein